jgi:hypothetical protein
MHNEGRIQARLGAHKPLLSPQPGASLKFCLFFFYQMLEILSIKNRLAGQPASHIYTCTEQS